MAKKKKKKKTTSGEAERIYDWSGGMNNAVNPALLNDNESVLLEHYTLDEKGTLFPARGSQDRYAAAFGNSPVAGMGAFYKSNGVSQLVIGTEAGELYTDLPHLVTGYDTQGEFNNGQMQAAVATSDGKVWPMVVSTGFEDGTFDDFHTRDSGWEIDDTVYKSGAKSAKGTGTEQKLIRELGLDTGQAYVKLACRFAEADQMHYPVVFISPTGTEIQAVVAAADGSFKYHDGSALAVFPTAKAYVADTWYVVEVWVRGGTFWVSIGGESLTPDGLSMKDAAGNSQSKVSEYQAQNAGDTEATMWLDDVTISLLQPVFSRASKAYKEDGSEVAANQPRYETGQFGQAVMVEEGTENLIDNSDVETDTTGWTGVVNTGSANFVHATQGYGSSRSLKIEATADDSRPWWQSPSVTLTENKTYTVSVWVKVSGLTAGSIIIATDPDYLDRSSTYNKLSNKIVSDTGGWTRLTNTFTVAAGQGGSFNIRLWAELVNNGCEVWFDRIQVEEKTVATTYQDGIRARDNLEIPTSNIVTSSQGTVELWVYITDGTKRQTGIDRPTIFGVRRGSDSRIGIWFLHRPDSAQFIFQTRDDANNSKFTYIDDADIPNGWHLLAIAWSEAEAKVVMDNGIRLATISDPYLPGSLSSVFTLGCYEANINRNGNILIDDARVSIIYRTDQEVADAYNSGQPLPVDDDTTYKLSFDDTLDPEASHAWISPAIDVSNATDKSSGHAALEANTPGGSAVAVSSRSAPDSTGPWTDWVNALSDGTLQHTADDFVQVRLVLTRSGEDDPSVDQVTVSFDGQASATLLASDFTAGGQFFFGQLSDYLVTANGIDAPRKYDGTTLELAGGDPPHASYVAAHKNRLWLAKGSRLYFSDLLDVDSWPVLNFIDVMPNDGDEITGVMSYGDYLIISKGHSMWMLQGEGKNTFRVKRIHADRGAYAPRSLCIVNQMLCFVSDDGIYFSDFIQPVIISERMRDTWAGLNKRRLNLAASWFSEHKLYVAVPDGSSQRNSIVIVYDAMRQAFAGIRKDWSVSCWVDFREAGEINTFFGRSDTGQVRRIHSGYSDNGQAMNTVCQSKDFSFGAPEVLKRWNRVYMQVKPAALAGELQVSFVVDGVETSAMTVSIPAETSGKIHTLLLMASQVGVVAGHRLGIVIRQAVLDNPIGIQTIYIESMPTLVKPSIWG